MYIEWYKSELIGVTFNSNIKRSKRLENTKRWRQTRKERRRKKNDMQNEIEGDVYF